jgi:hypothetical protein
MPHLMKKFAKKIAFACCWLIIAMLVAWPRPAHSQSEPYRFGYALQQGSSASVFAITPASLEASLIYELALPKGALLRKGLAHPNGTYFVLAYGIGPDPIGGNINGFMVVRASNGEILAQSAYGSGFVYSGFAWAAASPLLSYQLNNEAVVLAIDLDENPVKRLPATGSPFAISPDGSRLIALQAGQITAWGERLTARQQPSPASQIGPFSWSPDSRYVAFFAAEANQFAEAVVYDLEQDLLISLAAPTTAQANPRGRVVAQTLLAWRDANTLLVGHAGQLYPQSAQPGPPSIRTGLVQYDFLSGQWQDLTPLPLAELALQPNGGQIAYRLHGLDSAGRPVSEAVQLANFSDNGLGTVADYAAGCDLLSWAGDGSWLAYRQLSQYCWEQPIITFVEASSTTASNFVLAVNDIKAVRWLGWLR